MVNKVHFLRPATTLKQAILWLGKGSVNKIMKQLDFLQCREVVHQFKGIDRVWASFAPYKLLKPFLN